ncbi:hypothetical protein DENIS_0664 [Desulfonema ishimotonii]|uniref:DUF4276 domain-containing protein n=1 Tax=Desulfonema ishimotonii TaxID=45657 RepID=A0A401FRZ5_9BACT|nr:DUF4276 family protein [Desulfonema ishimotonii]GBC59723.1 hypothetical protein DENIS_0664 [Desulfonema ishimotonii]
MVVWVFSGGGEAELEGLTHFLGKNFPDCRFVRMTPVRPKKGPKVGKKINALGKSGKSLRSQIRYRIRVTPLFDYCDLILVLDDLDCRNATDETSCFSAIFVNDPKTVHSRFFIAFAAPELEAWLIADWNNTFAADSDFRSFHERLRYTLSTRYHIPFNNPENFSQYDPATNACEQKLSDEIKNAVAESSPANNLGARYSKGIHTPRMLQRAIAENIAEKCPLFRDMYDCLNGLSR